MGTWGTGPFDDDNASDWAAEAEEAEDWSVVEQALRVPGDGYLEAPDGQTAWAAAAVVAAADDGSAVQLPENVSAWVDAHRASRPAELRALAVQALQRVLGDQSELAELWQESGDAEWRTNVQQLASRLAA